mgnify:CR=1 FL=1
MGAITHQPRPLSLVIPTWNGGPRFLQLLDVLDQQDVPGGFQLVVVDSTSRDGTPEAARARGALVHQIPQSEFGHGKTRNLGLSLAAGRVVALLTQDAVPMDRHYLSALEEAFADESIDGAYARQFPQPDCDPILAERLRRWSASRDRFVVQELVPGDAEASRRKYDSLEPMQRLMACAFDSVASAVRKSTWQRIPYPDVRFGEDVAWGKEVLLAGGRIAFEPRARVEHSHPLDIKREFKRLYCDHKNLYRLFGVRNVPTWGHAWRGWKPQSKYYAELIDSQAGLSEAEKRRWKRLGHWHALFEASAQFLGARSWWKCQQSAFWRWFDRRIQRGV